MARKAKPTNKRPIKSKVDPRPDDKAEEASASSEDEDEDDEKELDLEDRKKDYSNVKKVKEQLSEIYNMVVKGFEDKSEQNQTIDRAWDMYNCVLNENQMYSGVAQIYVPIVRDAIEARCTRFTNQVFPQNGRYADIVGQGGVPPWDLIAVLDHYVRQSKLKSLVIPALMREGDCSGQYSVFIDWSSTERHIVRKVKKAETVSELGTEGPGEDKYDDREFEAITEEKPDVMVLDARNLCVLPTSVDEIDDAEVVAIAMWLTKGRIKKYVRDGVFDEDAADMLLENFDQTPQGNNQQPDTEKKAANQAGVRTDSKGSKRCLIYRAFSKIKIKGEYRMCDIFFAGEDNVLSCKRLPFWNDRIPVISKPVLKVPGSFWGKAPAEAVEMLQYQANDAVNMGMDSASYALLPIVMTDPEKNPKIGSMILAQAAIWETNPTDTQFAQFPPIYKEALNIVGACKDQIMQSFGVNTAMMPHGTARKKPSQAEIAQEQQVALESTSCVVSLMEEGILTPLLEWFYDLDYQFRTKKMTIQKFGQMGLQADLQQIPLFEDQAQYVFKWNGTEANKTPQQVQQMIAAMNVIRGIPKDQLRPGMKVDISPIIEYVAGAAFGPRMAPKILIDESHQQTLDPITENELMLNSFPVPIHPGDNDVDHIMAHNGALKTSGDMQGFIHQHIMEHMMQMKAKSTPAPPPAPPGGMPGIPGGAGPGVAGTPRIGAQPQAPSGVQNPPGAVHADQMPLSMPRKMM